MTDMEVVLDILSLHRQGLSHRAISRRLGIHRDTVKKYVDNPSLASQSTQRGPRGSQLDGFMAHIRQWLDDDPRYKATWIYDQLVKLGFSGSYELVKLRVRALKSDLQRVAYERFETEPGRQAQVDFGEFQVVCADGSITTVYLFAMILGYSRDEYVEWILRCDLPTFLDCHIRAFAHFGGVPQEIIYDRMKNVYLGRLAGKARFNPALVSLGLHYGFSPLVAPAYSPWIKGKVERPFDFIREGFWRGYSFIDLEATNKDGQAWLRAKRERIHGTTHERVSARFEREQPYLGALPESPFDTSYRLYRRVHKDCTVRVAGNSYVVDHRLVGKEVVTRLKADCLRIFDDQRLIVSYTVPAGKGHLVQDPRFYQALRRDKAMNARKYTALRPAKGRAKQTVSPTKGTYDIVVEQRPAADYDRLVEGGVR